MRITGTGDAVRFVRVEIPQRLFRMLESHKASKGVSINKIAGGLLIPALEAFFAEHARITDSVSARDDSM